VLQRMIVKRVKFNLSLKVT